MTGGPAAEKLAPRTLAEEAWLRLRREIIDGTLRPGERLKIELLRERYGIGASPLREALNRLAAEGLALALGQRGFRVAPVSLQDLNDITRTRILLECEALKDSIEHGDVAWEAQVTTAFHRLARADADRRTDFETWERANREFHEALISRCTSRWLLRFRRTLYDQHKRYRNLAVHATIAEHRDAMAEHDAIRRAALTRDIRAAATATEVHLRRTARVIVELISQVPEIAEARTDVA